MLSKNSNTIVFGIFLLVCSLLFYFILGNILKILGLFLGLGAIILGSLTLSKTKQFISFLIISSIIFLGYIIISLLQNHENTTSTDIAFSLICFILLICGYCIGQNAERLPIFNIELVKIFSLIAIVACLFYFKNISQLEFAGNTRNYGKESLNSGIHAVGIAYSNALLFLVLYFCYIQYSSQLKKIWKLSLYLALILVSGVAISSQSRGALVFVILVILLNNIRAILKIKFFVRIIFQVIVFIIGASILFYYLIPETSSIYLMVTNALDRFGNLFTSQGAQLNDASSLERKKIYTAFFQNWDNYILFGQNNYSPYPHNQFLEIVMRWGIFGLPVLILAVFCFAKALLILFYERNKSWVNSFILLLFLFCFFQSLTSLSLEYNRLLWLGYGFVLAKSNRPS